MLKISFPVVERIEKYCLGQRGRCILLQMAPIPPVGNSVPTMGNVIGMTETGKLLQFTMALVEWERLSRDPVTFVETKNDIGSRGSLLDSAGHVLIHV